MAWLQSCIRFPAHSRIMEVGRRDSINRDIEIRMLEATPEVIEAFVRQIVYLARPELQGCTIWYLDFSPAKFCWEIGVDHPSLPAVANYAETPREHLFKEDDGK